MQGLLRSWGKILAGTTPALSIEITRECPLTCPGCYAYSSDHLGESVSLRQLSDHSGPELVDRFFELIDHHRPLHVSIVGGEPLVRYRELSEILPRLADRGIHTQVVTSAVRPIPAEWSSLRNLELSVSIDGLCCPTSKRLRYLGLIFAFSARPSCVILRDRLASLILAPSFAVMSFIACLAQIELLFGGGGNGL